MKNTILVFILAFSFSALANEPKLYLEDNNTDKGYYLIPDIMNKVLIHDKNSESHKSFGKVFDSDSLPVLQGYPKLLSNLAEEGGIYCQMDSDSDLEIVYCGSFTMEAWNIDGSSVQGWPVSISYLSRGAPAYGDIDGDGAAEIVLNTSSDVEYTGMLYAFELDGTPVTRFPINTGHSTRSVVLCDLDLNGSLEIITSNRLNSSGEIYVYKGDGTVYPGWPQTMSHVPASSSAAGDITGDGIPEIISESYDGLYAWDRDGNLLPGFPFHMPNGDFNSYSSPVLADIDGDNIREIIFGTHVINGSNGGYVYILKNSGTVMPNWPKRSDNWIFAPPVVGYLNDDKIIDIVVGDICGGFDPLAFVYGWDKDGNDLNGFPIGSVNGIHNQITLADINNDGMLELIIDDNISRYGIGSYHAFNHDGSRIPEWDIPVSGASFYNMPCLADLNNDGILDFAGGGYNLLSGIQTRIYLWNTGAVYNPTKIVNPVFQFNVRHNGVFGDNDVVSVHNINNEIPSGHSLRQNYPNPFNPTTNLEFRISELGLVTIKIYDEIGREVKTLVNEKLSPGSYQTVFDGAGLSSGIYFYRLSVNGFVDTKRMILLK